MLLALPGNVGQLKALKWLKAHWNQLAVLAVSIGLLSIDLDVSRNWYSTLSSA